MCTTTSLEIRLDDTYILVNSCAYLYYLDLVVYFSAQVANSSTFYRVTVCRCSSKKKPAKLLFPLKENEFCKYGPKRLVCFQKWKVKTYNFSANKENMNYCWNTPTSQQLTVGNLKSGNSMIPRCTLHMIDISAIFQNSEGLKDFAVVQIGSLFLMSLCSNQRMVSKKFLWIILCFSFWFTRKGGVRQNFWHVFLLPWPYHRS